jgi:biopolymer transport protein ExbB
VLGVRELIDTILAGGPVMVPLALCSIIALGAFFERLFALRLSQVAPPGLHARVEPMLRAGRFDEALAMCGADPSAVARLVGAAIQLRGLSREDLRDRLEELGRHEAANLERFIPIVGTVASIAPLLGLLGTVGGMIVTFATIQEQGMGDVDRLAGGISQALVTTFAGLSIGIPALIANRFLLGRVDRLLLGLEEQLGRAVLMIRAHGADDEA